MDGFRAHTAAVAAAVLIGVAASAPALAQDLKVGLSAMAGSMDPYFRNSGPDVANMLHVYDKLILQDEAQKLVPGLATSWKRLDDTTWEIELRPNVTFHDGSAFGPEDVVASVKRASNSPGSNSPFSIYTKAIKDVAVVGPTTLRLTTAAPNPLLPQDLSTFGIVSRNVAAAAKPEDFNKSAIGTGPFKLVEYVPGERVVYARNDAYWGKKPHWQKVLFRLVANPAARVAALRAGDVDLIETVPADDAAKLLKDPNFVVSRSVSNRVIYLILDSFRDQPINMTDNAGQPLPKNPLKDMRVRKAISLSVNRDAIIDRVLQGEGIAAGQLLPEGFFGADPALKPDPYDPDTARKLLAEAGYPQGFQMTIHGSSGRYYADEQITQALGQMLTRIGIRANVDVLPRQVYADRGTKFEFSLGLYGWGTDTGEASSPLKSLLHTRDGERGFGTSNRGRFSDAALDKEIETAIAILDDSAREAALKAVTAKGMALYGIVPLWFQENTWASRKGIAYTARRDEFTLAQEVGPL